MVTLIILAWPGLGELGTLPLWSLVGDPWILPDQPDLLSQSQIFHLPFYSPWLKQYGCYSQGLEEQESL